MAVDRQSNRTNPGHHWELLEILVLLMAGLISWGLAFLVATTVK